MPDEDHTRSIDNVQRKQVVLTRAEVSKTSESQLESKRFSTALLNSGWGGAPACKTQSFEKAHVHNHLFISSTTTYAFVH